MQATGLLNFWLGELDNQHRFAKDAALALIFNDSYLLFFQ